MIKPRVHRNDEPLLLPTDCVAVIFRPEGVEIALPTAGSPNAAQLKAIERATVLFGQGPLSDEARTLIDELIQGLRR